MPRLVPTEDVCPACGEPIKALVRRVNKVEYVDLFCTSCDWHDDDDEGGT